MKKYINYIILLLLFIFSLLLNIFIFKVDARLPHISTFTILLITLFLILSNNNLRKLIGLTFLFLINIKVIYSLNFNGNITISVLHSILETNINEALFMLGSLFLKLILPSLIFTAFLFYLITIIKKNLANTSLLLYSVLSFTTLSIILVIIDIKDENRLISDIKEDKKQLGIFFHDKVPLIFGDAVYLLISSYDNNKYANIAEIEKFNHAIVAKKDNDNKNIILIMGEASLYSRYSAYGYHFDTTPHMTKLFSTSNSCIVNNAHSSSPITRDSLSMTLAFHTPENEDNLFNNKSIIEMAKANGYKTYWLGSQEIQGLHGSKYGFIAQKSNDLKLTDYNDNKLANLLVKVLSDNAQKRFIIIHLYGNHLPYNNYDEIDKKALPNAENYDLTIHHTDRIINDIFKVINEKKIDFNLIYTADHGEIVNVGHGLEKGREQYLIPFMYKSTNNRFNCDFIESFRNKDGYLSGLMNKYILSELLGYEIDKNILRNEREYDRILTANENILPFSLME
ncbi:Phosphoethanolamine transferase EptC [Arsenophonus nasoniae]|uniref:Phosphoethanolamine transferase EptC n=2 Tax=Arsenophonus nasoniae TaxID=638 RepID=A0A4P7KWN4_9GAMM|nr:phosphoethanolamine transferase [Arsenophonus nasoniae]QBY44376.1 Phosphoethanolamine transferase EptC [Arsenophonus nasoniae]